MSKPRSGEATPRRDFLRTLVLAPAAAAAVGGCATSHATGAREGAAPEATAAGAPGGEDPGLRALHAVPLELSAEPAFVFRAAPARPGE